MKTKPHSKNILPLYQQLELMIIDWSNNGTKTAGILTRKILKTFSVKEKENKR